MDVDKMIAELRAEQRQIDLAIAALLQIRGGQRAVPGESEHATAPAGERASKKRHMSAEGRKAVGDAARKRWAAIRAAKAAAAEGE